MTEPLWQGDTFAGKYRVETILGKGGMGLVLGARHLGLDEPVAIKVLLPEIAAMPDMVERFLREGRTASKVKSEHVVRIMDVDVLPGPGVPYIVMERLEGEDLASAFNRRAPLPVGEVLRWILEACEAIAEAHALGIVHRDLKPGNLFLARRRDGSTYVKVLDFGISKMNRPAAEAHHATETGVVFGSPYYMAPEQMVSARRVDERADIWSLGVILYQLLTGELPFQASTAMELGALVLHGPPPRRPVELRPELPQPLDAAILRCLERDRERRFAGVGELAAELRPFADRAGAAQLDRTAPLPPREMTAPWPPPSRPIESTPAPREARVEASGARSVAYVAARSAVVPPRPAHLAGIAITAAVAGLVLGVVVLRETLHAPATSPAEAAPSQTVPVALTAEPASSTRAPSSDVAPAAVPPSASAPDVEQTPRLAPSTTAGPPERPKAPPTAAASRPRPPSESAYGSRK